MDKPNGELKIWIAIRADLNMSPGKIAVQSGHAFMYLCHEGYRRPVMREYFADYVLGGGTTKVAVRVDGEEDLRRVCTEAEKANIPTKMVIDFGRTELEPMTPTVAVFGPAYRHELPPFLKRLQLY